MKNSNTEPTMTNFNRTPLTQTLIRPIILASQSPRRSQILKDAGFTNFIVRPTDTDETIPNGYAPEKVAAFLAEKKAKAAIQWITNDEIILAADTIVILDKTIFGKPTNHQDAFNIIRALSGKMHKVVTGVCLMTKSKKKTFSDTAKVYFDELSDEEINFYINTYKPFDKAGAYAIQEHGDLIMGGISGSFSNVVGLPLERLQAELAAW